MSDTAQITGRWLKVWARLHAACRLGCFGSWASRQRRVLVAYAGVTLAAFVLVAFPALASAPPLSPEDQQVLREALAEMRAKEWAAAKLFIARARDPLPAKIMSWFELTGNQPARFEDIVAFADANPRWPLQRRLRLRAEEASAEIPDSTLLAYFAQHHPISVRAKLRWADMLAGSGQQDAATRVIRDLWLSSELDTDVEAAILERHGARLRGEDHVARLDRLLWDGKSAAAQRQIALVPEDWQAVATARLALAGREPNVDETLSRVPAGLRNDPGLLFDQIRFQRIKNRLREAAKLLSDAPKPPSHPAAWWAERDAVARQLLDDGEARLAYDVAAQHGLQTGTPEFAEAEFLSGWIALRRLHNPKAALEHFGRMRTAVKQPADVARAAYWAGRTAQVLKQPGAARERFAEAAEYFTTYYGQLAAERIGRTGASKLPSEPETTAEERASFETDELVRAARVLADAGEPDAAKMFLLRLYEFATKPAEHQLVGSLADAMGHRDIGVMAARKAEANGVLLLSLAYPVLPVGPDSEGDLPLALAIARQESQFNKGAVSSAGARGLMQLMPATAQEVSQALSLPYSAGRLVTDADYNLTLGRAYLGRMLGRFNRSHVLAVAAYNAGPARVSRWLTAYGDPRRKNVDAVDWVETIPLEETRNYVQRVLENLQIYRIRLGATHGRMSLLQDLEG